jgi:hypothetical protein
MNMNKININNMNLNMNLNKQQFYECLDCSYRSGKKSEWKRHLETLKHLSKSQIKPVIEKKKGNEHICHCGKKYKHHSSLYTHKKKCKASQEIVSLPLDSNEIIINLLKQNNELHKKILEMNTNTNTNLNQIENQIENQTNITNNNTTFNLNFFLNETCKDAMNIEDFIASIHLQLKDLLHVGQVGYVRGISDIIIYNLKKLDITKRPLHCSDYKREIMYIKDKDIWEKDTEQKERLRKVVKEISMINSRNLPMYKEKYPDCWKHDSKKANEYDKILIESLGGIDTNIQPNQNKIMKQIAKEVLIQK